MTQISLKNRNSLKVLWAVKGDLSSSFVPQPLTLYTGVRSKHTAFKSLSFGKRHKSAGRNASGSITIAHRGGGAKRLQRRIDFRRRFVPSALNAPFLSYERSKRPSLRATSLLSLPRRVRGRDSCAPCKKAKLFSRPNEALNRQAGKEARFSHLLRSMPKPMKGNALCIGKVERIEYDPNRSSRIALVRWGFNHNVWNSATKQLQHQEAFTYILASADLKVGDKIRNLPHTYGSRHEAANARAERALNGPRDTYDTLFQQVGNCMPLSQIPIGTLIHNLEWHPGQGGKLVRAAGTFARLVQKVDTTYQSIVRLPSGVTKLLDSRCRATIGVVSNLANNTIRLTKAGQTRWLGQRPTVRGVAMNPIDHPHGGGEGRTKGGRPSVSPWGKPTKGGFKTVIKKRHK